MIAVYILSRCDLDLLPIFTKLGSRDQELMLNTDAYCDVYKPLHF